MRQVSNLPLVALTVVVALSVAERADARRIAIATSGVSFDDVARGMPETRGLSPLDVIDFSDVRAPLTAMIFNIDGGQPNGWPAALSSTWDGGVAACHARGDGSAFTMKNKGAWLCSRELSKALLQAYLDHVMPDEVVVVVVSEDRKTGIVTARAERFAPSAASMTVAVKQGRDPARVALMAIHDAGVSSAERAPRAVVRPVPKPPAGTVIMTNPDLMRGSPKLDIAVVDVTPCPAARVRLDIGPKEAPIATTLSDLANRSLKTTEADPALACTIDVAKNNAPSPIFARTGMSVFTGTLTCEGMTHVSANGFGIHGDHAQKDLAPSVLKKFVEARCATTATP